MTARESLSATVRGSVQGVGFRGFVVYRARALGLDGHVRNLADGSVEVYAEGPRRALDDLRRELARGPAAAHITGVDADFGAARGVAAGFHVAD
jgi:acylphosphatase